MEEEDMTEIPPNLSELALEWAACRRALAKLSDLTGDELDEFALIAATTLLGLDVKR
jgi:hypothetical protein